MLSDELNHASIIDGIRLCKANKFRYKHMDMQDLEAKLKEAQVRGLLPHQHQGTCLAVLPVQKPLLEGELCLFPFNRRCFC